MISVEALPKIIDTSQLTSDLDGTLTYDHSAWLETRKSVEEFAWQAADLLDRLDDLQEDLARNDFADDVGGAKHGIDMHNEMKKKIMKAPVEEIDILGEFRPFLSWYRDVIITKHLSPGPSPPSNSLMILVVRLSPRKPLQERLLPALEKT